MRRPDRIVMTLFGFAALAGLALLVVYWIGGHPSLEGTFLGVALGG
jgi:hypothetical protein